MGKHKNINQTKILLNFMECHQDIARGYVKGDKVVVESLWRELAEQLNSAGPPSKILFEWKKNWADWKAVVKKKMYHNKKENKKTGGGEYNQYVLTDLEESMGRICGFYKSLDGITGVKTFGESDVEQCMNVLCESNIGETICENSSGESEPDKENEEIDFTPSTSNRIYAQTSGANKARCGTSAHSKRYRSTSPHSPDPKRARSKTARFTDPDKKRNGNKSSAVYTPHQNTGTSVTSRQLSLTRTRPCTASTTSNVAANATATPKRHRVSTPSNPDLKSLLSEDNKCLENLVNLKTICKLLEDQRNETKILNDKLERLCNILEKNVKTINYTT